MDDDYLSIRSFDEAFFTSAAECGVRSFKFDSSRHFIRIPLLPALAFGLAEPTGGDRSISRVQMSHPFRGRNGELIGGDNFLAELIKVKVRRI